MFEEQAALKFFPDEGKGNALHEFGRKFAEFIVAECDTK
jgi:hypothetical protein